MLWQKVLASLPNRCQLCQQPLSQGSGLCPLCLADADAGLLCLCCSTPLTNRNSAAPSNNPSQRCGKCLSHKRWRVLQVAYPYHNDVGRLVAQLKVTQQWSLLQPLCQRLAEKVTNQPLPHALVPIPMHPSRLRQRSCNHALLIATELGRLLQLPVRPELLHKVRATDSQHRLNGQQRRQNLHGSFACADLPRQTQIALVDDIVTTGTTMKMAASALQRGGHQVSQYWALASAMARRPSR